MIATHGDQAPHFNTIAELLQWRGVHQTDAKALTFLADGELEQTTVTFGQLASKARAIGAWLHDLGLSGQRALLILPPDLDYAAAILGALSGGVTAVPVNLPRPNRSLSRLELVAEDSRASVVLTTSSCLNSIESWLPENSSLRKLSWLSLDQAKEVPPKEWQGVLVGKEDLAFVQYTSGSTSDPRGVLISHGNLMSNSALISQSFEVTTTSSGFFWLPLYHDMGLVGGLFLTLYCGLSTTFMSPYTFLMRPMRWLHAISRLRANVSGGPGFAYDICARKVSEADLATLDLSCWDVAAVGAEPISAATLEHFAETFKSCGFRKEALYPCYGLAEATLLVSGGRKTEPPIVRKFDRASLERKVVKRVAAEDEGGVSLVSCGRVLTGQRIVIADEQRMIACQPNEVGEIWVVGPGVGKGYWNRKEATVETFHAYLTDTGEGPFLRTGDLGFIHDEELFLCGRLKDLIIIDGLNHHPQDIEETVMECDPLFGNQRGVVFSIEVEAAERIVVIQELGRQRPQTSVEADKILDTIRRAIVERHDLPVSAILLVKAGSLPRTSSGKPQRNLSRQYFLSGDFKAIADWRLDEVRQSA